MCKANVLVVGGGGVGTIVALNLAAGQQAQVTLVLRSNYTVVQDKGFNIDSVDHGHLEAWWPHKVVNSVPDVQSSPENHYDYIVCCMKSIQDIKPSIADIVQPAVTPGKTAIILIQNGLNIEKPIVQAFPSNPVISGVTFIGSHEPSPGVIEHSFRDIMLIGAFDHPNIDKAVSQTAARDFAARYSAGGKTDCTYVEDANRSRWEKLIYNGTLNPVCAIMRTDTSSLRLSDSIEGLVRPAMEEIRATAKAKGYEMPLSVVDKMINIDPEDLFFKPSMCVDAEKGNLTEYEVLVGEPLREGLAFGVPMPTMTVIYEMCKLLQWQIKQRRER